MNFLTCYSDPNLSRLMAYHYLLLGSISVYMASPVFNDPIKYINLLTCHEAVFELILTLYPQIIEEIKND